MSRMSINNLGIPPLAGVCSYEDACKVGINVDRNVNLLKRYVYIESQLNKIYAAHLACTPEWEVKCAISLHMWLVSEHSAMLRKRITEMREPPLHLDKVPDVQLEAFFQELIRAENTIELVVGIYDVVIAQFIHALKQHLSETNALVDHPTFRILKIILAEKEEMASWGRLTIAAIVQSEEQQKNAQAWKSHLESYLQAAGGISGESSKSKAILSTPPRFDGNPFHIQVEPRRDSRFKDNYNSSAKIDEHYRDDKLQADERTYALLYKRLREMDVPEWMGPIIYKTEGKPWEYYQDLSRQLWDEARHSMLGEVGLYQDGVEFYKYPIEFKTSVALNTKFTPIEAHAVLWYIEQGLMPKESGKRFEWVVALESDNELAKTFQDYDWADEVLHAQIGRKWLVPDFGSMEKLKQASEALLERTLEEKAKLDELSDQKDWWPQFMAEIRDSRERVRMKR
jgi:hypothetical protein